MIPADGLITCCGTCNCPTGECAKRKSDDAHARRETHRNYAGREVRAPNRHERRALQSRRKVR